MQEYIAYLQHLLKEHSIAFKSLEEFVTPMQPQPFGYDHINRYKRQMVLKEILLEGQKKLDHSRILIVGAGGIGAPAALYLAGAGIGVLGLVDGDQVEESNLHRQIIHSPSRVGMNKARSAQIQLNQFNPLLSVEVHPFNLTQSNVIDLFSRYDIILDATDNPAARYLINDAAVALNKPLVSGSSVGWEGQITVYGMDGPCYRCLFPECPKVVQNCNEAGVFGVMPGIIGLWEAMQAVKLIVGQPVLTQRLLLVDGLRESFKVCKIRGKVKQSMRIIRNCPACLKQIDIEKYDYQGFAGIVCAQPVPYRGGYKEIEWSDFRKIEQSDRTIFLDVRPSTQFNIINLKGFINIPMSELDTFEPEPDKEVYIMCRKGNNSRLACEKLCGKYQNLYNIVGGIEKYARLYDPQMPFL